MQRLTLVPSCTCCLSGYHLPYYFGGQSGIFSQHDLEVEVLEPQGRIDSILAVASGRYDCCLTSVRNFIEAKESHPGLEASFIFMVSRCSHIAAFVVDHRPAAHGRPIESLADLAAASFLRYSDAPYMGAPEYDELLRRLDLDPGPVVDVTYAELYEALAAGKGDVAVSWLNLLPDVRAIAQRFGVDVRPLPFYEAGLQAYGSGIVAGKGLIASRPEVLRRLVLSLRDALMATRRDPNDALAALFSRYPDRDPERAKAVWTAGECLIFPDRGDEGLGAMDFETWEATIAHHTASYGTHCFDPGEAFDPTFAEAVGGMGGD